MKISALLQQSSVVSLVCGAVAIAAPLVGYAADALTNRYNNARTGAVLDETVLTTANVRPATFGKRWTLYADGQIVAQPLYVSNLAVDTSANPNIPRVTGTFNAVIVATMHNTVYVYDADQENRGPDGRTVPLWATGLGPPRPGGKDIDMWSTNDPEWGILSTPVVSPDKRTLYVAAWHGDDPMGLRYMLHALDLRSGSPRRQPVVIGKLASDSAQPCRPQSEFNPCVHKQRPALLLANGTVYVGFGGDGNRGALFAFDAETLAQQAFWSATAAGNDGGIWQSGQGPSADADGNVYLMTGNGSFDPGRGNYGNSFVKLRREGASLVVRDFFTPCNFGFLNSTDLDLGSGGPVLLPDTPARLIGGGKEGVLYLLSPANMGKFAASPTAPDCQNPNAVQEVRAFDVEVHGGRAHYPNIHGSPVYWRGPDAARLYAWGENNHLHAYIVRDGRLQEVNAPRKSGFRPPMGMPGGMLTLSANGRRTGSGILWAVTPLDGDANTQRGVKGIVLALDAQDVTRTLWTSEMFADRDRLGLFAKFNPPLVAGGKLFVPTYGNDEPKRVYGNGQRPTQLPTAYYVAVYGLIAPVPPRQVVNQNRDDVTVVRAVTSPLAVDRTQCAGLDALSVDCTATLTAAAKAPAFHQLVLPAQGALPTCRLIRVTTASKDTGLANASGIGFWSAGATAGNRENHDAGRFIATTQLERSGAATLSNGAAAVLHDFVGLVDCGAGDGPPLDRLFKPYMQFEGAADGKIFRNWDLAANYRISRAITQFDRSGDVLRP